VAITAEGNRETALAVGCDGFIQKPIDARSFAKTVQGYLTGRREQGDDPSGVHLLQQSQRIALRLEEKVDQLSEANARLIELDQARKEFYRNVSHELATPMTPIVGYLRLLRNEELGPLAPGQAKALKAVDECAERLRGLIDNLLDVTAIETGKMRMSRREYDFLEVARRALAMAMPVFADRRIQVFEEISKIPCIGYGDPDRLQRALVQLLDNAAKFTPEGGRVGVRAQALSSHQFEFCVADSGPGVPPDAVGRVFDPFYQADGSETRSYGGAGVGLAVVRGVAQGHGGYVRASSPADEVIAGERFTGAAFAVVVAQQAGS
jgi:signal transduction histidine kinase